MRTKDFSTRGAMLAVLLTASTLSAAQVVNDGGAKERQEVEQVVVNAYIRGIHGTQDKEQIRAGFHESFRMLVPDGEGIRPVSVEEWLELIDESEQKDPETWKAKTTYQFDSVDVTDNAASVKIQVYKDEKHFSTDYMLLYRFADGWKIVSKIFKMY